MARTVCSSIGSRSHSNWRTAAEKWARAGEVELEVPVAMNLAKHGRPALASLINNLSAAAMGLTEKYSAVPGWLISGLLPGNARLESTHQFPLEPQPIALFYEPEMRFGRGADKTDS